MPFYGNIRFLKSLSSNILISASKEVSQAVE